MAQTKSSLSISTHKMDAVSSLKSEIIETTLGDCISRSAGWIDLDQTNKKDTYIFHVSKDLGVRDIYWDLKDEVIHVLKKIPLENGLDIWVLDSKDIEFSDCEQCTLLEAINQIRNCYGLSPVKEVC